MAATRHPSHGQDSVLYLLLFYFVLRRTIGVYPNPAIRPAVRSSAVGRDCDMRAARIISPSLRDVFDWILLRLRLASLARIGNRRTFDWNTSICAIVEQFADGLYDTLERRDKFYEKDHCRSDYRRIAIFGAGCFDRQISLPEWNR